MTTKSKNRALVNVLSYSDAKYNTTLAVIDVVDGEKRVNFIPDPKLTFYVTKPEFSEEHALKKPLFMNFDEVEPKTVKFNDLFKAMGNFINETSGEVENSDEYVQLMYDRQFTRKKKMHSYPLIHASDVDIRDHYISKYCQKFEDEIDTNYTPTKVFSDIEVDTTGYNGFPDETVAPCPISAISSAFDADKSDPNQPVIVWLLRDDTNPLQKEFEENRQEEFLEYMKEEHGLPNIEIRFYDSELDMVEDHFNEINEVKRPDIGSFWNSSFDIRTFINRINQLGGDPEVIMCPEDFQEIRQANFFKDEKANDPSADRSNFSCSAYTTYLDQMIVYATIRATMGKKESYALDAVLEAELNRNKVDLGEDTDITNIIRKDYFKFVEYSVIDSSGTRDLERQLGDFDLYYGIMNMTESRLEKSMTKTICLRNLASKFFRQDNILLGTNPNTNKLHHSNEQNEKFKGALTYTSAL